MARQRKSGELINTAQLAADQANPRLIKDKAKAGLAASIQQFGDLSGIVFNRRTGQLVAGHRRVEQLRAKFGERDIKCLDKANGVYGIEIDKDHFFPVRVVDWSIGKQRAANVTANNQAIAGDFSDSLESYLLDVKDQMVSELGDGALDSLLLSDLFPAKDEKPTGAEVTNVYQVIVDCADEKVQQQTYDKLVKQGLQCRVITL